MTTALQNISRDDLLRRLYNLWPKYHAAREQEHRAWTMNDTTEASSWRKVREEYQRKINRLCGCLDIKPIECPTCGTIIRNTDREMLRVAGKTLPFDPGTDVLENHIKRLDQ